MSEEIKAQEKIVETIDISDLEETPVKSEVSEKVLNKEVAEPFAFFKNCSATLKKLSVAVFAINLFLIVILAVTGVVVAGMYIGWEVISLLAVPIISVIAILIVFARLVSALIYGFAEIVEKHEK